jgi:hypothetical protein
MPVVVARRGGSRSGEGMSSIVLPSSCGRSTGATRPLSRCSTRMLDAMLPGTCKVSMIKLGSAAGKRLGEDGDCES